MQRVGRHGDATCSLWFMAMDPDGEVSGRKTSFPIADLVDEEGPFRLRIGDSTLDDEGMTGGFEEPHQLEANLTKIQGTAGRRGGYLQLLGSFCFWPQSFDGTSP